MGVSIAQLVLGILGNIIASVFYASPVLTFWRILKKRAVEDFSGLPYVCCFFCCSIWTFYGLPLVIEDGLLILTINGAGAGLNLIFVLLFLIFSTGKERRKVGAVFSAVVFLGILVLVNLAAVPKHDRRKVVGSIALVVNIAMYAAPLSNTKLVIQTRSVEYLPFFFTFMAFVNATVWTTYSAMTSDIYIMIPNSIGIALGFTNLMLYATYYNAKPKPFVDDLEVEKNREVAVEVAAETETKPTLTCSC